MIFLSYRFYLYFFILALGLSNSVYSQTRIEDAIKKSPKNKFKTIDELAAFISSNADDDRERAYGAYYWIATHVVYDVKKYLKGKPSFSKPEKVFEKEKAVCEGYANLFKALCEKMNLQCEVIAGYSKGYGYQPGKIFTEADHAWNALKLGDTWQLIDVTWAAGSIKKKIFGAKFVKNFNNDFFFLPPKEFVMTHLPEIPMWQLLNHPVPIKTFAANNDKIYAHFRNTPITEFNYEDSIRYFFNLKNAEKAIVYGQMALNFNPQNTVPLALSVIVPLKYRLENNYFAFYNTKPNEIDSIITVSENAVALLKKSNSSRESVKELIEINLINGNEVLSELLFIKADIIKKRIPETENFDTLILYTKPLIAMLERSMSINRETTNAKQFEKIDSYLCALYNDFFARYTSLLNKETDEIKKKSIQREIMSMVKGAKKIINTSNSCYQSINMLK